MKRIRAWNIRAWNRLECYLTRLNVYNLVEFWFELVGTTYYLRILLVEINIKEQFISYLSTFKDFSSYIFKLFVAYTSMLPSSLLYEKAWHFHFSFCNCVLEHAANAPFHFLAKKLSLRTLSVDCLTTVCCSVFQAFTMCLHHVA